MSFSEPLPKGNGRAASTRFCVPRRFALAGRVRPDNSHADRRATEWATGLDDSSPSPPSSQETDSRELHEFQERMEVEFVSILFGEGLDGESSVGCDI